MGFPQPLISKSSSPYINHLVTVPRLPNTISVTVNFMFRWFFNSLFFFFTFSLWQTGTAKSTIQQFFLLLLIIISSGRRAEMNWFVRILKCQRDLCVSFSRTVYGLFMYHLIVRSNLNFLHNSQWNTLPTRSRILLYSFCASLLHSLTIWLIVSSLSLHKLHLIFFCV